MLRAQLVAFEAREFLKAHVQDGTRLDFAQVELVHQAIASFFRRFARPNQGNDGIDVVERDNEPLKNVRALFRLAQIVLRPTNDHFVAMLDVVNHHLLEVEKLRPPLYQRNVVH